ncbi:hypothetical protein F383_38253 [Gossypium arboreum]|uniref:Uncharacterized protein n=1 Tax=Gossypium arboreum TaxID=29729 RepID=A0A0B0MEL5_GOSAR|nr:hypothetical protein F383_38253 [Gossypium arboreum]
MSWHMYPSYS